MQRAFKQGQADWVGVFSTGDLQQFSVGGLIYLFPPDIAVPSKMIFVTVKCILQSIGQTSSLQYLFKINSKRVFKQLQADSINLGF